MDFSRAEDDEHKSMYEDVRSKYIYAQEYVQEWEECAQGL